MEYFLNYSGARRDSDGGVEGVSTRLTKTAAHSGCIRGRPAVRNGTMLRLFTRGKLSLQCRTHSFVTAPGTRWLTLQPKAAAACKNLKAASDPSASSSSECIMQKDAFPADNSIPNLKEPELAKDAAAIVAEPQAPSVGSEQWLHGLSAIEVDNVTIVRDKRTAAKVIRTLCALFDDRRVVAWDTETTGVNPKKESPCGKGEVICATAYAGDDIDFGNGPRLFIDCLDGEGGSDLLQEFKSYFEDRGQRKVWHHYSFDKHVLFNHGIHTRGFAGDTMHMARLADSSRQRYSLEELVGHYLAGKGAGKNSMKERFGRPRVLKDGSQGKEIVVPGTVELQRGLEYRAEWIEYATMDAELTHKLQVRLRALLEGANIDGTNAVAEFLEECKTLYDIYLGYFVPLGEMLTDMERFGFKVDVEQLRRAELAAEKDRVALEDSFRGWAQKHSPDAKYMNIHSDKQKQQLLFAPCRNKKDAKLEMDKSKLFVVEQTGIQAERAWAEMQAESNANDVSAKNENAKTAKKAGKNGKEKAVKAPKEKPSKIKKDVVLHGLGKEASEFTASGWPSVSASCLHRLAGKPRANPPVYGDPSDPEMCLALADLIEACSISTLSSTFMVPLQSWPGQDGRIHASLNLNTETGRLSSRRPNLQNQPALEKDRYKVRRAFVCEPGNKLIVADYGQLELRLLAHITKCTSMIDAFSAGGDFHSRTALGMFGHVADAVERGQCLLERDGFESGGIPLLKDMFATERRKAKTLNFSIAYGKTVMGLARDWNVTREEAQETLNLWYKDRPEVRDWQRKCRHSVREKGYVETIMGRRRHLPDVRSKNVRVRSHAERAAINAPLQGSAADIVMSAMVNLHRHPTLQALGWRVILQVHDEVILEGPDHSADIALPIVRQVMRRPVSFPVDVDLTVDSKIVSSWYDGK